MLIESGLNGAFGSLVLGGYDSSKFKPNNLTFDFGPDVDRDLLVQMKKITTDTGISLLPEPISIFLDSTVPYIYLPEAACAIFESTFGLVWDNKTQLYLLSDAQHMALQAQSPNITFRLGNLTSTTTVDITLPYSAFDLSVSYPIVANSTRYFPLKRASDPTQYTLGRTFFQEACVSPCPKECSI
jgi:Eukaryotic aspartyl protease